MILGEGLYTYCASKKSLCVSFTVQLSKFVRTYDALSNECTPKCILRYKPAIECLMQRQQYLQLVESELKWGSGVE